MEKKSFHYPVRMANAPDGHVTTVSSPLLQNYYLGMIVLQLIAHSISA